MTNQHTPRSYVPGPIALFGSGETSPSGQRIFDKLFQKLPATPDVILLETPAGFELNSPRVAGKVADFLGKHLQNYAPQPEVLPARKKDTPFSPDDPEIVSPILQADMIFMGPGSPSYAVRQLSDSLAWKYLIARHRLGAGIALASAASIAVSRKVLPVYEIYKVGQDLHWIDGLSLFGLFGLELVIVPHWNNNDGGEELDTSRCFMGGERFDPLMEMLPDYVSILGIDEQTGVVIDFSTQTFEVIGNGTATIVNGEHETAYGVGKEYPLDILGDISIPPPDEYIDEQYWQAAIRAEQEKRAQTKPPDEIMQLVEKRESARRAREWASADRLRDLILDRGWTVMDTANGPVIEKQ